MSSRTDRRLQKKSLKGIADHPAMKRMERNLKKFGRAALEVYRLDGETPDQHVYFDVYSMREWCVVNLTVLSTPIDWERAEQLVESGAVDREHIARTTIQQERRPIIVGRGAGREGDQILDGGHTYVAIALAATAAGQAGEPISVPAYLLAPEQWQRFVIPTRIAKALDFDATLDADDRAWVAPPRDWQRRLGSL